MNSNDKETHLPAEVEEALQQVIDYLWDDERESLEVAEPEARDGHVFHALTTVRTWLDIHRARRRDARALPPKGTRRFSARLGYCIADVVVTDYGNGDRAYKVTADLDTPSLSESRPMEFHPASADEVLDLFEVVDASNEFIEELVGKNTRTGNREPKLQVVAQGPRRES